MILIRINGKLKVFASRQDADKYLDKLVKRGYVIKVKDSD